MKRILDVKSNEGPEKTWSNIFCDVILGMTEQKRPVEVYKTDSWRKKIGKKVKVESNPKKGRGRMRLNNNEERKKLFFSLKFPITEMNDNSIIFTLTPFELDKKQFEIQMKKDGDRKIRYTCY